MNELEELNKTIEDMGTFYTALRDFLLSLESLGDDRVRALFEKYEVKVS